MGSCGSISDCAIQAKVETHQTNFDKIDRTRTSLEDVLEIQHRKNIFKKVRINEEH